MNALLFDTERDTIETVYIDGRLRVSVYRPMNRRDQSVICRGLIASIPAVKTCIPEESHADKTTTFLIGYQDRTLDFESVRGQIKRWLSGHLAICKSEQQSLF